MVECWQADLGHEPTGSVDFGAVVFIPEPSTVTGAGAASGDVLTSADPTQLSTLAGGDRQVVFPVPAERLDSLAVGAAITDRLPDRSELLAVVDEIKPSGTGGWTAAATVDETSDGAGIVLDGEAVPLTVSWVEVVAQETTTALTRLDSGAYVIEVVEGDSTSFVEVGIGEAVGSTIEIITDLEPGTVVISP